MRRTLKQVLAEYGVVAVCVYLALFFVVLVGSWFGIQRGTNLAALAERLGLSSSGFAANIGAWTAAYIFTKILQPVRIAVTLALTPLVARVYERVIGQRAPQNNSDERS